MLIALVDISFSSVGRAVSYIARGLGDITIFWRWNMVYCYSVIQILWSISIILFK